MPAHSVIWLFLVDALHAPIDPLYNDALKREIDKIAAAIPHDELAIQFDVASAVFARLERNEASSYGRSKAEMQDTFANILVDLGNRVPADVDLLYHLCYGDSNHRHVVEPTDMADMVDFANRVSRQIARPIQLIHMPVPRNRSDDAYFAPLQRLKLRPGNRTVPRPRSLHRRRRRHEAAARRGEEIRRRISPSPPNAASAAAIRARFLNCCASMPRSRIWIENGALFRSHALWPDCRAVALHLAADANRLRAFVERDIGGASKTRRRRRRD